MNERLKLDQLEKSVSRDEQGFRLEASFEVEPTERVALVGKSGVGKTTLLRMIAGLEPLDRGRIWIGSREITQLPAREREIGFVFQEQALFSGRSVFENVAFGLKMRKVEAAEINQRVSEWLAKLGLEGRARESIDHLSGGERQRVALARALVIRPKLILMDEPFTGLDPGLRGAFCDQALSLHAEIQVPLLFTSHDERDISRLATRIFVFEDHGPVRRVRSPD